MVWFTATAIVVITVILIIWTHKRSTIPTHAGGIVYKVDNERKLFLMVTSSVNRHKWVLPKGRIEAYETPQVAAAREVMEEAGVSAAITKLAGTVSYSKRGKKITVAYFVMEFNKQAKKTNEGRQLCWVEKQEVIKRLVNKDTAALMRKI